MASLYIDRRGIKLRLEGESVVIFERGQRRGAMPLRLLERLVLCAETALGSSLLLKVAAQGGSVIIIDRRNPRRWTGIWPPLGGDTARRLAQYRKYLDADWRIRWARRLLEAKLRRQRLFLEAALSERRELAKAARDATQTIRDIEGRLAAPEPGDCARLMGLEGAAAGAYFQAYALLFAPALAFEGRNRRPPRDPVNVCLSLGYTLAHMETTRQIVAAGLDPYLGFYHEPAHGRESLACDLVELERTEVERFVWRLFRERLLRPEHFRQEPDRCLLGKAGRAIYYEQAEPLLCTIARRQQRLCRWLVRTIAADSSPQEAP